MANTLEIINLSRGRKNLYRGYFGLYAVCVTNLKPLVLLDPKEQITDQNKMVL